MAKPDLHGPPKRPSVGLVGEPVERQGSHRRWMVGGHRRCRHQLGNARSHRLSGVSFVESGTAAIGTSP